MRKSSLAVIAEIVLNSAVVEEDDLGVRDEVKYGKSKKHREAVLFYQFITRFSECHRQSNEADSKCKKTFPSVSSGPFLHYIALEVGWTDMCPTE